MSRITDIAKTMKTWWNEDDDPFVHRALDEIIRIDQEQAPTIEPKRGEWINKIVDDVKITVCSNCNKEPTFTHYYGSCGNYSLSDFCPNCGARMKGADDE